MTKEEKLAEFLPLIEKVSRRVASEHHVVEKDDLYQELVVFVLQRGHSLPAPSEVDWSMQSFLMRVARMYAFDQKQQHYMIDPQESYEVKDVRDILATHFDQTLWDTVREDESVEDAVAAHSDVAWALDRLSADDKTFVANCYQAEKLPASGTKEYRKLRDIIIKIANMLNHWTRTDEGQGPGRRKAMSNSGAQALIDSTTNGY